MNWKEHAGSGVPPATLCAFHKDASIDAKKTQPRLAPLARIVHNFGDSGRRTQRRLNVCRRLMGKLSTPHFHRPLRPLPQAEVERWRNELWALELCSAAP
ncbi:MAG: hypothetical protein FJ404_09320 [Verrucomicrobia bacterium]|nr:hypothetical protein [Verrucomicrobiota bacterium]